MHHIPMFIVFTELSKHYLRLEYTFSYLTAITHVILKDPTDNFALRKTMLQ